MLYQAIVRSKLDYDVLCMAQHQIPNVRLLDSIRNAELRLALGAFYTSPVSSMYKEANEAPLEERCLKLLMHCYLKTRACTVNWAIIPYMNLTQRQEVCIFLDQMEEEACPTPNPNYWSQA